MANYELVFSVTPLHCIGCVNYISQCLNEANAKSNYFESYEISLEQKQIRFFIDSNDTKENACQRLTDWLKAEVLPDRTIKWVTDDSPAKTHQIGSFLGLGLGLIWMILALLGVSLPFGFYLSLSAFSSITMLGIAWPFVKNAWYTLTKALHSKNFQAMFNMDSLFVLTGIMVFSSSILSLFFPIFPHLLESGLMIFGFRHLGCLFQAFLDKKMGFSRSMIQTFSNKSYSQTDENNNLLGTKISKNFQVGEYIRCKPGDVIPIDGQVVWVQPGSEIVDNVKDGSYFSHTVLSKGDVLLAGAELKSGEIVIQVEHELAKSRFKHIDEVVREFQANPNKAEILQQTERWLQWFIPGILLLATVTGIWMASFYSLRLAIQCVSSILVSACPCTLGLIVPMAMRMGAYKASLHDVIFKSSEALQLAAKAEIFVLDFNGTLTSGTPEVKTLKLENQTYSEQEILKILLAIETKMLAERKGQLIGLAIQKFAQEKIENGHVLTKDLNDFNWHEGGASVVIDGCTWYLGNNQLLKQMKIQYADMQAQRHYLMVKPQDLDELIVLATLDIQDSLRTDAKLFVNELQGLNKQVHICTGADDLTAERIMQELNIEKSRLKANCSYEKKPDYIHHLKTIYPKKVIVMIGDGANDKPALEVSDLKMWIKNTKLPESYQQVLEQVANIEIHGEKLGKISLAFAVAQQTLHLIYQNLALSFLYNLFVLSIACGILIAYGISLSPAIGVSLMILQSAFLAMNTYRTLLKPIEKYTSNQRTSFGELEYKLT